MPRGAPILDGNRVREELDRLNLTQREFAQRIGIDEARLSNAIAGQPLSSTTIFRIALGLELAGRRR
jgi:plasmid maintenance system antidote protein VapI